MKVTDHEPQKASGAPKLSIPERDIPRVVMALADLGLDDQAIWELFNDPPDWDDLGAVASDTGASVQDVKNVAAFYFPRHKGTTQLIKILRTWPEETARAFVAGTAPESEYTKVVDAVGMERDAIIVKVAAWVARKFG